MLLTSKPFFLSITKKKRFATDYVAQFDYYMMRYDVVEDERMILSKFGKDLNGDLKKEHVLCKINTLD